MKIIEVSFGIMAKQVGEDWYLLLQKRNENGPLNHFLEFPGGKIEESESPIEALVREWHEEVQMKTKKDDWMLLASKRFSYGDREVHLHCFYCIAQTSPNKTGSAQWFKLSTESLPELEEQLIEGSRSFLNQFTNSILSL